jgi:mono/diheme cytochrome c family protein
MGLRLAALMIVLASAAAAADEAQVVQGRALYVRHCQQCHGPDMVTPGTVAYDLREFPHDQKDRFVESVTHGRNNRMPAWGDMLTSAQIDLLWAYVTSGGKKP